MRPPECEVCGERFDPSEGQAVRCLSTSRDLEWRERAERDGLVGHPPDVGWFCGAHVEPASALAPRLSLPDVVAALRAADGAAGRADEGSPERVGALHTTLIGLLPGLASAAGMHSGSIASSQRRSWSPMDGVEPPWCPFVDYVAHDVAEGDVRLSLVLERAHWGENDPARASLTLALSGAGALDFRVAVWSPAAGAPDSVAGGSARGAVPPDVAAVLPAAVTSTR